MDFPNRKKQKRIEKLTVWLAIVAIAAPPVPILKPLIRIGSRIILRIPPVVIPTIERKASPSLRRVVLRTKVAQLRGAAIRMKRA